MVVMAFLRQADLILKPQNLGPVFAHGTVHVVIAGQDFTHPIGKSSDHLIMIIEIPGLNKFKIRVTGGDLIGETIDPVD